MPRARKAGAAGDTPLAAVVGYAERSIEWRPFMSVAEVARLSGISAKTLLRWLADEPGLWDACGIKARGQRWIRTAVFRKWMNGELDLGTVGIPTDDAPPTLDEIAARRNGST